MDIAVIGSGITGLSAAWYLRHQHAVSLYERWPRLGMDAHTVDVDCGEHAVAVNVPMRVFFPEYYPTLTALYDEVNVAYEPIRYSGSFSRVGGDPYFRYRNYWIGNYSLPLLAGKNAWRPSTLKMAAELFRFLRTSTRGYSQAELDAMSIQTYLQQAGYSQRFADEFLFPAFAGICTCSYKSLRAYPASMILGYLHSGLIGSRVNRLTHGTQDAAKRLAASAANVHLGMELKAVTRKPGGVEVTDGQGHTRRYDHVVLATQANQALRLLPQASSAEKDILQSFRYEQSRIVVHRNTELAPRSRSEWSPVNFVVSDEQDKPMASILLNRIYPGLRDQAPVFETWNPFGGVRQSELLLEAELERPVVSPSSLQAISRLEALHDEPGRRIWFCGSYSKRGIPLLESATASAMDVATRLNAVDAAARAAA